MTPGNAGDEAAQEAALRQALTDPGSVAGLPPSIPASPPAPASAAVAGRRRPPPGSHPDPTALPPEGSGSADRRKEAHKAEQVAPPDNKNAFVLQFRAESLPHLGRIRAREPRL